MQLDQFVLPVRDAFITLFLLLSSPLSASAWYDNLLSLVPLRAVLEVDAFERLLGPCLDIMQRNAKDYETQLKKLGLANQLELRHSADQHRVNEL